MNSLNGRNVPSPPDFDVYCSVRLSDIPLPRLKRGGGGGGKKRIWRQVNCKRSCWGPFVIRCLEMETKFTVGLVASGSFHIFCNTQPGGVFVCQAHRQKKRCEAISRAMRNHILFPPAAFLPGVTGLTVSTYTRLGVSNPTATPPTHTHQRKQATYGAAACKSLVPVEPGKESKHLLFPVVPSA